ncbi:MAG: sulfatase [Pirellulaceae bacterium]|nr:sulfatase [Pirellulaceae bacterium]
MRTEDVCRHSPGEAPLTMYLNPERITKISVTLALYLMMAGVAWSQNRQPNVVLILADDLGWNDTTLNGSTKLYETPNIARLASRGMYFTRAHSASPLCSPTRASILTGLSPAKTGITSPNCHLPQVVLTPKLAERAAPNSPTVMPAPVTRLATTYQTLPKSLKAAGYATGHFGKWHLGHPPYSALEHGFDVDIPHWPGPGPAGSFVAPWKFPDFDPDTPDQHIEDRMAKEAVAFMEAHRNEPFYLNYWMFSVHAPFNAKSDLIDKYRQKINGTMDKNDPQRCPTYAAMIESMDDAVGTLLDTLDRLGLADNTIIVFTSDNGGNMYSPVDNTTPTSNAPLRGGKATMYEGGTRVPLVVSWPGHVKPNTRSDALVNSCDFYPTLLEMLAIKPESGQRFDGQSFTPALNGQPLERESILTYFPHAPPVPQWLPPSVSLHRGDYKLIRLFHAGPGGAHRWKLFNLRDDIGEQVDLADKHPEMVQEMDAAIEAYLKESAAVVPIANPAFDPSKYDPAQEGQPGPGHFGSKVPKSKPANRPGNRPPKKTPAQ